MERKIIKELTFLNNEIEKAKQVLDRQEKRKKGYIKQLIGKLPFKTNTKVLYKGKKYIIGDIRIVETPIGIPNLSPISLIYCLVTEDMNPDNVILVFEKNAKYMTKL